MKTFDLSTLYRDYNKLKRIINSCTADGFALNEYDDDTVTWLVNVCKTNKKTAQHINPYIVSVRDLCQQWLDIVLPKYNAKEDRQWWYYIKWFFKGYSFRERKRLMMALYTIYNDMSARLNMIDGGEYVEPVAKLGY